ncbi:hypothetical protein HU230_0011485 [Bradyrhizobium quebecense]|uniref:Uncharacterized protein n=1 Tax=Bradyrhizobium quebecense TaxID=2748629 RepID=A0A973WNF0_9BRAD|nr:hypothetical protein [Bradyrhizobium quebecense]UGA46617.1 hypothetical protein HU230_0011485 [Bradyrhizobium quebecense]
MTDGVEFLRAIEMAFPVEPLPNRFFWASGEVSLGYDIPQELENRISGRRWTDVTLMDWRMTGASPAVSRSYLEPTTFMYYLPSIIVGGFREPEFIEFALGAMIPHNKSHVPRGPWWSEFSAGASSPQRAALSTFLASVRHSLWDEVGSANQHLLEYAEKVWSG